MPILTNYDTVVAASGTGPIDLRIGAPTDPDGDPMTITLDAVPSYGVTEYFDGAAWVVAGDGDILTADELVSLRYTPPASGEFGGDSITYSVDDGTAAVQGTIAVTSHVVAPDAQLLLFAASDANGHNPDLYTVDSAGLLHSAAINPPNGSFAGEDGGFVQFGGATYFNAFNNVASFGGLFKMDAAGAVTLVSDGSGGYFGNQPDTNAHFTVFAGGLYFAGDVAGGGTEAIRLETDGSYTAFDVNPGQQNFAGANGGFVAFDGSLFFSAVTSTTNGFQPDLIRLEQDGSFTEISTRTAGNAAFGSSAGEDGGFFVFNDALYFNAYDDSLGDTLFRLDAGATTPVAVDPGTLAHLFGGVDSAFHIFAGSLYFNEFSFASGAESLFKLDDCGCLNEITYFNGFTDETLVNAGAVGGFVDFAGSTYFAASTSDTGLDLFRLDDCGCLTAIDVNPGAMDAFGDSLISGFVVFDGALYFDAYDANGDHLYRLDAQDNLVQVDLGGGGITQAGVEGGFRQAFGSLFFSAYTADGYEVVRLEKDGSYSSYDINPGPGGNSITQGNGQTFGLLGDNILAGGASNDIVAGSAVTETLSGGGGDDVLEARGGNDHLAGGDGEDLFVLSQTGAANLVTFDDYDFDGGDSVDLSALLDANFGPDSNVADFVRLFAVEGDIKLQVDTDGTANGTHWTDVAILTGGNTFSLDNVAVHFNGADYVLTESFQFNLQTVSLAGGGWAVTWTEASYEQGYVFDNVFGRVFDADGHQVGGTFQVSADDNGMDDQNNLVAALPNGNFAVVWQACENEIWTRVYHADGTPATAPVAVQPPDPDVVAIQPGGITVLSNGGYAVLWAQVDPDADGGENVYVTAFAADGTPASAPVPVNSVGAGSPDHDDGLPDNFGPLAIAETTQIVKLANGFAVLWLSERDTGPGGATEDSVFVRVFHNDGTPVTGEIQANSVDGGISSIDGGAEDFRPELVALGGNDFLVQWESDAADGSERSFVRVFDDAGYAAGAPIRLDANVDPDVVAESWDATALVNGGFVSLWGEYGPDASDVRIQIFDAAGAIAAGSVPGGLVVNQVSDVVNLPDQVLALSGGGFAILYDTQRDDGVGFGEDPDVYIRTYAADGTPMSDEVRVNPADDGGEAGLALTALPDGRFMVFWTQAEATANGLRFDILARVMDADGAFRSGPILVGSSPSDLSYAQEASLMQEFRDAVSANGDILTAAIHGDTVDLANLVNSLAIGLVPSPPVVDLDTGTSGIDGAGGYTEGGSGSGIGAAIDVAVGHAGDMIHGATVAISDPEAGDQLFVALTLPAGITIDVLHSTADFLVLTGSASAADYTTALGQVRFRSSSEDPTAGGVHTDRSIGVTVDDGTLISAPATLTMSVIGINDEPVLTATGKTPIYTENGAAVDLFGGVAASTVEANQSFTSLTLTVTNVANGASEILEIDGSSVALTNGNSVTTATHGLNVGVSLAGTTATVSFSGATLDAADLQTLLDDLSYADASENPSGADRVITITQVVDSGSNAAPSDNVAVPGISATVHVVAVIDPPVLDLDSGAAGLDSIASFAEGNSPVYLAPSGIATDLDSPDFDGGTLTVQITSGSLPDDMLLIIGLDPDAGGVIYNSLGDMIASVTGGTEPGTPLIVSFTAYAAASDVQDVLRMIGYVDYSNGAIGGDRTISFTLTDGDGGTAALATTTVHVTATDSPPALDDDSAATFENATISIPVTANDNDPDGPPPMVAQVDGHAIAVGQTVVLTSGATVKLEASGALTYDPAGHFNTLTSTDSGEVGAVNLSKDDSFTYTLAGGGTATVTVTVFGVPSLQDHLDGDLDNNVITGTVHDDYFDLSQGGDDRVSGLSGSDGFYFGAAFTSADRVDGGAGTADQIGLQGDYTGDHALVLGPDTITNVEAIVVLPGFSYDITTVDANVPSGGVLKIQATQLAAGQSLIFDGSAEHDGHFMIYGGKGDDDLTGGDGDDGFYFGPLGFNSADVVHGGPGTNDQLALDGDYTTTLGGNIFDVEVIVLLHGPVSTPNTFNITAADSLVEAGETMTIFGLQVETGIVFDGSAEHDGAFKIYGGSGNDVFTGSNGDDWIFGGNGGDALTGGAGNDIFYYDRVDQSTPVAADNITDFTTGDKIDVSGIDAIAGGSNNAFSYLGSGAFTNHAGELRVEDQGGGVWLVQGDTDGNGAADFELTFVNSDAHPITALDFTL